MKQFEKLIYTNERGESIEFSTGSVYHTNEIHGLSDIKNEIYSFNAMGQDGDSYLGNRIASREIEIIGNINVRSKEDMIRRRRLMSHVLNPQLAATLTYEYGDFRRIIDCNVDNAPIFERNPVFQGFTVQLICLNPFWKEEKESRVDIARWVGCFQFPLEILHEEGIELGYREPSQFVNVTNNGDVSSAIRIELRAVGTVINPQIMNVDTGEYIQFNTALVADDVLSVTTHYGKKAVTLHRNGLTENAFRYFDADSTYLQLGVGDNILRYNAEQGIENLEVSIYHQNLYLGV